MPRGQCRNEQCRTYQTNRSNNGLCLCVHTVGAKARDLSHKTICFGLLTLPGNILVTSPFGNPFRSTQLRVKSNVRKCATLTNMSM